MTVRASDASTLCVVLTLASPTPQANENEVDAAEYLPSVLGRASTQTWAPTAGDYQPVVWH